MTRAACAIAAAVATLLWIDDLRAQPRGSLEIEITDRGTPLSGVQISDLVNRAKRRRAATGADGRATVPADALGFSPGETVAVWIRRCEDGQVEVILVPRGEDDPCVEEGARAGEECGCDELGAFLWGDGGKLVVDVGAGTVTFTPGAATGAPTVGWSERFTTGFTLGATYWNEFETISGDAPGAGDHDATTWSPVVGLFMETGIPGTGLRLGIAGHYAKLETETAFPAGTQTGEIGFYGLGLNARYEWGDDLSRTAPYVFGGFFHSWNKGDFRIDGGPGDHRVHKTWRGDVGLGFVHWLTGRFGVWAEGHYSPPAGERDADEHVRIQVGAAIRPFWKTCGGTCMR